MFESKTLIISSSSLAAATFLATFTFFTPSTQAAIVINAQEVGGDLLFSYSGSLDLTDFNFTGTFSLSTGFTPSFPPQIALGTGEGDSYIGSFLSKPDNFGTGDSVSDSSANIGGLFAIFSPFDQIFVPTGYNGGTISGSSQFPGVSFASAGIDTANAPYVWTLGNGDTITLQFTQTEVPEPLTMLGASAAIAFGAAFKRRKAQ